LPPGVLTPGSSVTKSSALRLTSGRFDTSRMLSVVDTAGVCVCTIAALSPCTTTLSSMAPSSSTALTAAGTPALMVTSLNTTVLNPCSEMVTV
jgi:hypothetical protein